MMFNIPGRVPYSKVSNLQQKYMTIITTATTDRTTDRSGIDLYYIIYI